MSTEYRRGIPSVAHVEAATRLGLLWQNENSPQTTIFEVRNGEVLSNYGRMPSARNLDAILSHERSRSFRPIRTDGTSVDWEVLDAEVARAAQPATVTRYSFDTGTIYAAPTTQPQGFRADLWQALSSHLAPGNGCRLSDTVWLDWRGFRVQNPFFTAEIN